MGGEKTQKLNTPGKRKKFSRNNRRGKKNYDMGGKAFPKDPLEQRRNSKARSKPALRKPEGGGGGGQHAKGGFVGGKKFTRKRNKKVQTPP